ncbi:MAG: beta-glucanase (GH16 family) [Alteromonadaceae bacterium]|jgi:beta-glucanase (GH16 family)
MNTFFNIKCLSVLLLLGIQLTSCGSNNSTISKNTAVEADNNMVVEPLSQPSTQVFTQALIQPIDIPDVSQDWQLVWSDEFDGNKIDREKWSFEVNCFGGGNNEQQCYTQHQENAYVEDGVLNIVAIKAESTGPKAHDDNPSYRVNETKTLPYSSARLRTKNSGDWRYGRFEIRAKLPKGQGTWPAIWMLPTDWKYGAWPLSGEIDIMEAVNLKTMTDELNVNTSVLESRVHGTLHYGKKWPENVYTGTSYRLENYQNPADDFHQYAIEWQAGEIRWYVDGVHYATQRSDTWFSQTTNDQGDVRGSAPFDQRFHLILNLAMGGNWPDSVNDKGIDESILLESMKIDYVRIYQCSLSLETGQGCEAIGDDAKLVVGK